MELLDLASLKWLSFQKELFLLMAVNLLQIEILCTRVAANHETLYHLLEGRPSWLSGKKSIEKTL